MGTADLKTWEETHGHSKIPYVHIPKWDEIIHIRPRYKFTPRELEEWKKPPSKRDYSVFTEEGYHEIERRRAMARRIRQSPAPQWARKAQQLVTWIDNIEDAMSTLSATLAVATLVQPEFAEVTIPIIAGLSVASTAANIFNAVVSLPLGPMGAKRAAGYVFDAVGGRILSHFTPSKAITEMKSALYWSSKKGFFQGLKKLGNWRHWAGTAIEAAQTADTLFDRGLCLGGIMGAITDFTFAQFKPQFWHEMNHRLELENSFKRGAEKLKDMGYGDVLSMGPLGEAPNTAMNTVNATNQILSTTESITGEDLIRILTAHNLSLQILDIWASEIPGDLLVNAVLPAEFQPWEITNPDSLGLCLDQNIPTTATGGSIVPYEEDPGNLADGIIGNLMEPYIRINAKLDQYADTPEKAYCREILNSSYKLQANIMTDGGSGWKNHETTHKKVVESLTRRAILPPFETPIEAIEEAINKLVLITDSTGKLPSYGDMFRRCYEIWGGVRTEFPSHPVGPGEEIIPNWDTMSTEERQAISNFNLVY